MDNKEFARILERRTKSFAVAIIKFTRNIPESIESRIIKRQVIKSGTSIGANYREANKSKSKPDFAHKIKICEGESNETLYWLEIILDLNMVSDEIIKPLIKEADELTAIFTSISGKLRN